MRRTSAVLDFVRQRGSAHGLDDQLRCLSDNDAMALENSYALTRFITWAIPILGFLGTVLGITQAIAGVTPERLEQDLSTVTDGLALAFDTTALGLALTMITMFFSFLVERTEQGILEQVDRFADRELAHRFEQTGLEENVFVDVVRQNSQILMRAMEQLVQRQADLWAKTIELADRRRAEVDVRLQERVTATMEKALDRTMEIHTRRLSALEKQTVDQSAAVAERLTTLTAAIRDTAREHQSALVQTAKGITVQAEVLAGLQEGERNLLQLQEALQKNLSALAGAGAFEQAIHSLTAAIHLMTARAADLDHRKPSIDIRKSA